MDIGSAIRDSFDYAKESVWQQWKRWILLTIMSIIFPLMMGYTLEIYRGKTPPPEIENLWKLFVNGLKYFVAICVYFIPVLIVTVVSFMAIGVSIFSKIAAGGEFHFNLHDLAPYIFPIIGSSLLIFILGIITVLISTIGIIRMARTESFMEAYNFSAILQTIREIGWGSYLLASVVLWVISFIVGIFFNLVTEIPYLGFIIMFFVSVVFTIFEARYLALVYESANQ
ncbi:MAG TPA: DUF4013 domain-containing protein [Methanospirillum sp.]|uniref:DUF4013 domain-containing protein n=1 Tax=Methanospirillum sp. TaxID=45200 RepID=UPI002C50FEBC|nr:DUF4013 domain-containing protein [Methanospirillum sp.]HWQ63042.1 DUF4013 domain-containing protein [Methanospirillum sp.]